MLLAKSRSAKTAREVELKAMPMAQTCNLEKHTQPCLSVCIQTQLL